MTFTFHDFYSFMSCILGLQKKNKDYNNSNKNYFWHDKF